MTEFCECCHVQLIEGAPVSKTPGLCSKCDEAWQALLDLTNSACAHFLARALVHSGRDAARRLGCTASAHNSALTNASHRRGVSRDMLTRVAAWALRTGRLEKPEGFEDCNPSGVSRAPIKAHVSTFEPLGVALGTPSAKRAAKAPHGNFLPADRQKAPTVAQAVAELLTPTLTPGPGVADGEVTDASVAEDPAAPPAISLSKVTVDGVEVPGVIADREPTTYLSIPEDLLADMRAIAAMKAEDHRRRYELMAGRLSQLMLRADYLDDVPAYLRVAFDYGVALGESRALEAIAK